MAHVYASRSPSPVATAAAPATTCAALVWTRHGTWVMWDERTRTYRHAIASPPSMHAVLTHVPQQARSSPSSRSPTSPTSRPPPTHDESDLLRRIERDAAQTSDATEATHDEAEPTTAARATSAARTTSPTMPFLFPSIWMWSEDDRARLDDAAHDNTATDSRRTSSSCVADRSHVQPWCLRVSENRLIRCDDPSFATCNIRVIELPSLESVEPPPPIAPTELHDAAADEAARQPPPRTRIIPVHLRIVRSASASARSATAPATSRSAVTSLLHAEYLSARPNGTLGIARVLPSRAERFYMVVHDGNVADDADAIDGGIGTSSSLAWPQTLRTLWRLRFDWHRAYRRYTMRLRQREWQLGGRLCVYAELACASIARTGCGQLPAYEYAVGATATTAVVPVTARDDDDDDDANGGLRAWSEFVFLNASSLLPFVRADAAGKRDGRTDATSAHASAEHAQQRQRDRYARFCSIVEQSTMVAVAATVVPTTEQLECRDNVDAAAIAYSSRDRRNDGDDAIGLVSCVPSDSNASGTLVDSSADNDNEWMAEVVRACDRLESTNTSEARDANDGVDPNEREHSPSPSPSPSSRISEISFTSAMSRVFDLAVASVLHPSTGKRAK